MAFIYSFTDLWTVGGTTYDAIKVDVTDTASAAASLLLNLSVGGSVKASIRKDGHILGLSAALGGATIGSNALAVTGTAAISGQAALSGNSAASTPIETLIGTWFSGGSTTTTKPHLLIEPSGTTSTAWSTSGTGLGINAATGFVGQLADLQLAGVSKFRVDFAGGWNGTGNGGVTLYNGANANPGANSDYASLFASSNIWFLLSGKVGSGTQRDIKFGLDNTGTADLYLRTAGTDRVKVAGSSGVTTFSYPVVLTGGTLADQAQVLAITATQPASPSTTQQAITATITSAGSASQANHALAIVLAAGYTGISQTAVARFDNNAAGTGTDFSTGSNNLGFMALANSTTTGTNVGSRNAAIGGNISIGSFGQAVTNKNSATNVGVVGHGLNGGTTPVQIGGYFALLNSGTLPSVSAALIADNGAQTDPIFLARDNGSTVFTIADGGNVTTTGTLTTLGGATFHTTSTALTDGAAAQVATLTNGPTAGNPTKWIGINDNGTTRYIPAW